MRVQCIDLPLDSVPCLYAVADLPTMAKEQSVSLRCLWRSHRPLKEVAISIGKIHLLHNHFISCHIGKGLWSCEPDQKVCNLFLEHYFLSTYSLIYVCLA